MPTLGRFELRGQLGRGGMGVVYRAFDPSLGREVAIKGLHVDDDPEMIARFKREAREAARLRHPRIVGVHEFSSAIDEKSGREVQFMVMDLIEGTSLAALIEKGPIDAAKLLPIIAEVADALGYAHRNGVVHRDVKPGNILIDSENAAFLADFGLARTARVDTSRALTESGAIMGTIPYMAPEQARGESAKVGPPADVYALGATLYHGLTGRLPIDKPEQLEMLRAIVEEDPPPPAGVARELQWIVMKCLEKEPGRRYRDGADLAADLRRFLAGDPVAARPASLGYRLRRRLARNPAAWGLGAVAAIALTIVGARMLQAQGELRRAREFEARGDVENALASYKAAGKTADVERLAPRLQQLQWARRLQRIYFDLLYTHGGLMEKLAAAGYANVTPDPALLRDLRKAVDAVKKSDPDLRTPDAILAWGRLMCGEAAAEADLLSIADSPGRPEPFVNLLRARWHLKVYHGGLALPTTSSRFYQKSVATAAWVETEEMKARYSKALKDLKGIEALPVWRDLSWGRVYRDLAAGLTALVEGRRDPARLDEAVATFREVAYSVSDVRLDARYLGGLAAYLKGDFKRAAEFWTDALRDQSEWVQLHYWLGLAHQHYGEELETEGLDGRNALRIAIDDLSRALALNPGHAALLISRADVRRLLAQALIDRGEKIGHLLEESLADLLAVDRNAADSIAYLSTLGIVRITRATFMLERGADPAAEFDAAVAAGEKALALNPQSTTLFLNHFSALRHRARGSAKTTDTREDQRTLIEKLTARLKLEPESEPLLTARMSVFGDLAQQENDRGGDPRPALDGGQADIEALLRIRKDHVQTVYNYAMIFYYKGIAAFNYKEDPIPMLERARDEFTRTLELRPGVARFLRDRGDVHLLLARARNAEADLQAAAEDFKAAAENQFAVRDDALKLAEVLLRLGRAEEAIAACERGLQRWPDDPELKRRLDDARRKAGVDF